MATPNQVVNIPPEIITQSVDLVNQLKTLLAPYMEALTNQERKGILKMGDKTIAFVTKALDYAQTNPQLAPQYMDTNGLADDMNVVNGLTEVEQPLTNLSIQLDDTIMLAGSEAYSSALVFYNAVKYAAGENVPGAKAIFDDLKIRFDRAHTKNIPPAS